MSIEPHSPSVRARQARIRTRPAEAASLAARIQFEPSDRGGYRLTLIRKYTRTVFLSADEAAYLSGLMAARLPEVTVTQIPDSARLSLACRGGVACGECTISWCRHDCHDGRQDGAR
jgi:hypothetical protein